MKFDKVKKRCDEKCTGGGLNPLAAWDPGVRGGMHAAGVNAGPSAGTLYSQGSAGSTVGEYDFQLAEHQLPVLTSGTPALRNTLRGQIEHPAQRIIVGKAGLSSLIRVP